MPDIRALNRMKIRPQSWPDCDRKIRDYVMGLVEMLKDRLGDNLTGVYLHGSLAMGSRCSASMKADRGGSGTFRRSIRRLLKRPWKYTVVTGRSAKPKGKSAASRGTGRSCLLSAIMRGQWQRTGVRDLPQMSRGMTIHRMELDAKCR